jgi:transcription termination/antitermination protein NusG
VTKNGEAVFSPSLSVAAPKPWTHCSSVQPDTTAWFAVQTRPRHEKKVSTGLREKGISCFLPLHRAKRQWSDRQKWVDLPLFSHYVFVNIAATTESRVRVLQTSGVVQFVGTSYYGTPIPDEQIENLRSMVRQGIPLAPHEFLRVGERVRICGGALNGIEGVLVSIRNDKSLVVSVDLIQKSVAIRIDGFEVERVYQF